MMTTVGKTIFLLVLVFMLESCNAVYDIQVNKDGSADVSLKVDLAVEGDTPSEMEMREDEKVDANKQLDVFFDSPVITNTKYSFENEIIDIAFSISTVDSLGKYLSPLYDYPVSVEMDGKQFKITGTDGKLDPECDVGGYTNMITVEMTIRFKRKIDTVEHSESIKIKSGKKHIHFTTSLGEMDFSGKQNYLIVNLK